MIDAEMVPRGGISTKYNRNQFIQGESLPETGHRLIDAAMQHSAKMMDPWTESA